MNPFSTEHEVLFMVFLTRALGADLKHKRMRRLILALRPITCACADLVRRLGIFVAVIRGSGVTMITGGSASLVIIQPGSPNAHHPSLICAGKLCLGTLRCFHLNYARSLVSSRRTTSMPQAECHRRAASNLRPWVSGIDGATRRFYRRTTVPKPATVA